MLKRSILSTFEYCFVISWKEMTKRKLHTCSQETKRKSFEVVDWWFLYIVKFIIKKLQHVKWRYHQIWFSATYVCCKRKNLWQSIQMQYSTAAGDQILHLENVELAILSKRYLTFVCLFSTKKSRWKKLKKKIDLTKSNSTYCLQ